MVHWQIKSSLYVINVFVKLEYLSDYSEVFVKLKRCSQTKWQTFNQKSFQKGTQEATLLHCNLKNWDYEQWLAHGPSLLSLNDRRPEVGRWGHFRTFSLLKLYARLIPKEDIHQFVNTPKQNFQRLNCGVDKWKWVTQTTVNLAPT